MQKYLIEGGKALEGEVSCKGAKNSSLPILAACLMVPKAHLKNVPGLSDVSCAIEILKFLGCSCKRNENELIIENSGVFNRHIESCLTSKMRSSVLFAGSLLSLFGSCSIAFPGGCSLGERPVDMHISSFQKLGYRVLCEGDFITASKEKSEEAVTIKLPFPSVGATENIILASVLRKGTVDILNPAKEPEIADLAEFLNKAGAVISIGNDTIHIAGKEKLGEVSHSMIPDRIEAVTYMAFAAGTGGKIHIKNCRPDHFQSVSDVFSAMGCKIIKEEKGIYLSAPQKLEAVSGIRTLPYPYFPTDAQSVISACLLKARGNSDIEENIFSSRFAPLSEFRKMGADIVIEGRKALIKGVESLKGAELFSSDLRGGAALVLAALEAEGTSIVRNISHIERGYENLEGNLTALGAPLKKIRGE